MHVFITQLQWVNCFSPKGSQKITHMIMFGEFSVWLKPVLLLLYYIDGLAHDCNNFTALAVEFPQFSWAIEM